MIPNRPIGRALKRHVAVLSLSRVCKGPILAPLVAITEALAALAREQEHKGGALRRGNAAPLLAAELLVDIPLPMVELAALVWQRLGNIVARRAHLEPKSPHQSRHGLFAATEFLQWRVPRKLPMRRSSNSFAVVFNAVSHDVITSRRSHAVPREKRRTAQVIELIKCLRDCPSSDIGERHGPSPRFSMRPEGGAFSAAGFPKALQGQFLAHG